MKHLKRLANAVVVILGLISLLIIVDIAGRAQAAEAKPAVAVPVYVYEGESAKVNLMDAPCVDMTTKMLMTSLPPDLLALAWKHIDSTWNTKEGWKPYAGCWAEQGDEVIVIFEDQTGGRVKKSEFDI